MRALARYAAVGLACFLAGGAPALANHHRRRHLRVTATCKTKVKPRQMASPGVADASPAPTVGVPSQSQVSPAAVVAKPETVEEFVAVYASPAEEAEVKREEAEEWAKMTPAERAEYERVNREAEEGA